MLKKYLVGAVVNQDDINEAEELWEAHFGQKGVFNRTGWEHIVNWHNGRLPVEIKAVPEGTIVPTNNVLMTIENTDPKCYWLTNWLETLLVQVWYPTTIASLSRDMKTTLLKSLDATGTPENIDFKLHDFGFRGVSSVETAGIGASAHLINFKGTDNFPGIILARDYYNEPMAGNSIPASEHSTITSWGKEHEVDAMRNMLKQYPTGLVACVSDSYDIYDACTRIWGEELRDTIMQRKGCLVIRPDSGEPTEVVIKCLDILGEKFGFETNDKGYKVLDPHVRLIQGDGIGRASMEQILRVMEFYKWSADNIAFGSGGGLLQKVNRDTNRFAFKCSSIIIDGVEQDVWKSPITDSEKQSKRGRLELKKTMSRNGHNYYTISHTTNNTLLDLCDDELQTVFMNGELKNETNFGEIRERAKVQLSEFSPQAETCAV